MQVEPPSPSPGAAKGLITPRRVVMSIIFAGAVVMLLWAFNQNRTTPRVTYRDAAIVSVQPDVGDLDLRQMRIGVTISPSWTGVLQVDGVEIPDDQVERVVGLNQIYYTPGPGKITGALAPGQHCATALVWPITETRTQSHPYTWCFNVH